MKIAIPQWQGRVSPVFDVAGILLLIDIENKQEIRREERPIGGTNPIARSAEFLSLGTDVLICGAISASLEARIVSGGVRVIGFTCGTVDEVLSAFLKGELSSRVFMMPGCHGWRRRQGGSVMPGGFGMGAGRGAQGRGQGRGQGGGRGRMGGPMSGGPGGFCVCPSCGEKTPHVPGQPCNQAACPKCGTKMTRSD
jgi:predicted Fe-Mo cluster-binding NifX family protein